MAQLLKTLIAFACCLFTIICAADAARSQTPQFTTASLSGICGLTLTQVVLSSGVGPSPTVGTLNFNGAGAVTLSATQNKAGTIKPISESGTYAVNPDGRTGTIDFSASAVQIGFVIVAAGRELRFINTGVANQAGLLDNVTVGGCDF